MPVISARPEPAGVPFCLAITTSLECCICIQ
nr:MAG TPA: hypothetical protein [Caudoviricetes sp.]